MARAASDEDLRRPWWGVFDLEPGRCGLWQIEPLSLAVMREPREWRLAPCWRDDDDSQLDNWHVDLNAARPENPERLQRYAFSRTAGPLRILPVVADRPVVTSPRVPLFLPPEEEVTVYVGSPLWIRVEVGEPPKQLVEMPIRRPSDTWFGSSTREGELCYATRTRAIVDIENIPALTRRAITPLTISNRTSSVLPVERLKLPVPYLSVYASVDGQLWTPTVTMEIREGVEMASFNVGTSPPAHVEATRLSEARERPEAGVLIRAFSLFQAFDRQD